MADGKAVGPPDGWLDSVESRPAGVLLLGLAASTLLVVGMLSWWAAFGFWPTLFDPRQPLGISFDGRNHLTMAVLLGFVLAATRWTKRVAVRALETLKPASTLSTEAFSAEIRHTSVLSSAARGASFAGAVVVGIAIIPLSSGEPGSYLRLSKWNAHHVWAIANHILLFTIMFRSAFRSTAGWRALDRISRSLRHIDLLDREALAPIGRYGFPGAILWLAGGSLASLLAWGMENVWPLVAILCAILALATFSMLRPMQIVHGRLHEAKRGELKRVREKIANAKEASLSNHTIASDQAALLPGLLAYEVRIESVREWPFDTPTLLRFAALALLAVGSWLGGAVVERALGAVIG